MTRRIAAGGSLDLTYGDYRPEPFAVAACRLGVADILGESRRRAPPLVMLGDQPRAGPFSFHRRGRVVIAPSSSEQPAEANVKTPSKKKAVKKKSSGPGKKTAALKKAAAKKTVAKKPPGKPRAAPKTAKRAKPAPDDAVIVWRGRKNPFREGTGAHERTERLREHDGQRPHWNEPKQFSAP
jgi:hypothetical protein